MAQHKLIGFLFSLFCGIAFSAYAADAPKVDGLWEATYKKSDTPSSHIRISTLANGEAQGIIEKAYPRPGVKDPSPNCTACTGSLKDKPIVGMRTLWGMKPDGNKNEWSGGHVLDPEVGKVYSGKMKLSGDGKTLTLRGYVGTPLLGETVTWKRIG